MKKLITFLTVILLFTSCAHNFMRGTVAMTTGKRTAHICLGDNDVAKGDLVDFYINKCTNIPTARPGDVEGVECEMKIIGNGVISKILNSHYSEVKTDGSFKLSEGIIVQRKNKK